MISLQNVSKRFVVYKKAPGTLFRREKNCISALDGLSFSIQKGEIVGYIGPNGAGKSTTIKIMAGILSPSEGDCRIMGRIPYRQRKTHVRHIGVVFGQRSSLWWDVPVLDSFTLLRDIYSVDNARFNRTLDELSQALDIGPLLQVPARQLSLGQRMRCEVAAALLHEPEILFLDEPTIGLDAVSKLAVRDFILELNARKQTTVLLTTHDMNDIDALATRVMLIGHGKLAYDGTFNSLRADFGAQQTVTVRFSENRTPIMLPGVNVLESTPVSAVLSFDAHNTSAGAILSSFAQTHALTDFSVSEPSVEQIMARVYQEMAL